MCQPEYQEESIGFSRYLAGPHVALYIYFLFLYIILTELIGENDSCDRPQLVLGARLCYCCMFIIFKYIKLLIILSNHLLST